MPSQPLVSVIMAARDAEATLSASIASVREQNFGAWELLVVDDGSSDLTAKIVMDFSAVDERIQLLQTPAIGAAGARNYAASLAVGKYLMILDADDRAFPTRMERQVAQIESEMDDLFGVCSVAELIGDDGRPLGLTAVTGPRTRGDLAEWVDRGRLIVACHPTCMVRADRFADLGGYDPAVARGHDAELINRAVYMHGLVFLWHPEPLTAYRLASTGLSTTGLRDQRMTLRLVEMRNRDVAAGRKPRALSFYRQTFTTRDRLGQWRRDTGAILFRSAGASISSRRYVPSVLQLLAAVTLHPNYALRKIWQRAVSGRSFPRRTTAIGPGDARDG